MRARRRCKSCRRWPARLLCVVSPPIVGFALFCWVSGGDAADIHFGGVVPGLTVITKSVKSMRELRFVNVVEQKTDFSCGAAAVATILRHAYGMEVTEPQVLIEMYRISDEELVRQKGFSLLDIKRYFESLGLQAIGLRIDAENLDKLTVPTIVLIDIRGYNHFVVLKKAKNNKAYLADPALGNKVMEMEDFVAAWNGVVLAAVSKDFDPDTILLKPKEKLSARRLMEDRAPYAPAPVIGFGNEHADLLRF